MGIEPEVWHSLYKVMGGGIFGAALTSITLFAVARQKAITQRNHDTLEHALGMTKEQRLWLEALHAQIQTQVQRTDDLQKELVAQREYYEARIDEIREGYRKELAEQDADCRARLQALQDQLDAIARVV